MTLVSEQQKWVCKALGSWGFLYTNPCIDPDQELAESSGRWEQSPFDHIVVMTSSRSSSLTLKSWNTVEVPQGIMAKYVNYSMYIETLRGGSGQFSQLSDFISTEI